MGYRRLCGLLRRWREVAGLTQRALASGLRKPPSYVHKVEVGDRRIDPLEFIAWCRACGLDAPAALAEVESEAVAPPHGAPTGVPANKRKRFE